MAVKELNALVSPLMLSSNIQDNDIYLFMKRNRRYYDVLLSRIIKVRHKNNDAKKIKTTELSNYNKFKNNSFVWK